MITFEKISKDLRDYNNWVLWILSKKDGRKIPYNAKNGKPASTIDSDTWSSFADAVSSYENNSSYYNGIGFCLGDGIYAIDIDHCIDKNGIISNEAQEIIERFASYTEISQSGTGIHIFFRSTVKLPCNRADIPFNGNTDTESHIEVYSGKRYIACTGNTITSSEVHLCDEELNWLIGKYYPVNKRYSKELVSYRDSSKISETSEYSQSSSSIIINSDAIERKYSNTDVINNILIGQRAESFKKLYYDGDWESDYESQSEADLALCGILVFYTCHNFEQVDEMFRDSALYNRPKWDEKRGDSTYGDITINKAMNDSNNYNPLYYIEKKNNSIAVSCSSNNGFVPILDEYTISDFKDLIETKGILKDADIALLLAKAFNKIVKYCSNTHEWYYYNGTVWLKDDSECKIKTAIEKLSKISSSGIFNEVKYRSMREMTQFDTWKDTPKMKRIIDATQRNLEINSAQFDNDIYLLNCQNGTYDLRTLQFREHRPSDYIRRIAHVEYNSEADCPLFKEFLDEIFISDKDTIEYVQKLFGLCLTGNVELDKFFIFWGKTTRNGKTTLLSTIQEMLGTYAVTMTPSTLMVNHFASSSAPSEDVARLDGVRLAICYELPDKTMFNCNRVKHWTGGGKVPSRNLYKGTFEYIPKYKLLIDTNYLPSIDDDTVFKSDRVIVIPMLRHFEKEERDVKMSDKLQTPEMLSGILNWCIEGYKKFLDEGLNEPQSILSTVNEYRYNYDTVQRFMEDNCVKDSNSKISITDLYDMYLNYCTITVALPKNTFTARLRELYSPDALKKGRYNGSVVLCIMGFKKKSA